MTQTNLRLSDTTSNDFDLYYAIVQTIQSLCPIKFLLVHIKGHQDAKKCNQYLSLHAWLNIKCDACTNQYLSIAQKLKPKPNPMIPQCYPHLQLAGSTIVQDLQESLWHAVNTPDYHDYMR